MVCFMTSNEVCETGSTKENNEDFWDQVATN